MVSTVRGATRRLAVCTCALFLFAGAAVPNALSAASVHTVAVKDDFFSPSRFTIHRGDVVSWRWRGSSPHNVTGANWSSPTMRQGTYSRTFRNQGTFRYRCTLHPGMGGRIIVD